MRGASVVKGLNSKIHIPKIYSQAQLQEAIINILVKISFI